MILETDRLILRGWREDDAASLFKYAKDERIGLNAGWLPHKDEHYSRAVIRTVLSRKEAYAICLKGTDSPIGGIGLVLKGSPERPLSKGEAELGFWVGYPFWGKGIVPEAAKELMRHSFMDLGINVLYCGYFVGNERSKRVQEKLGFAYHHTNAEVELPMLGESRMEYMNFMTYDRWIQMQSKA